MQNTYKKRLIALITAIVIPATLVFSGMAHAANELASHRYEDYVTDLKFREVIEETSVDYKKDITQEQFLRYLLRNSDQFDRDLGFDTPKKRFSNVPNIMPYAPYVYTALNIGLIEMPENRVFQAKKKVNKVEGLKMVFDLYGLAAPLLTEADREYKDVPEGAWYIPMISRAMDLELTDPENLDFFGTNSNLSIGDTARMLSEVRRILENQSQPTEVYVGLPDIEGIDTLYDVYSKIQEFYYYEDEIKAKELTHKAITGMVNGLDDRYSVFNTPVETNDFIEQNTGNFQGVGMWIERGDGDYISVAGVIPNSPAEAAGMKVGDKIIKVDGEDTAGWTPEQLAAKIKGPAGTEVTLYIEKHPSKQKKNVKLIRAEIDLTFVEGEVLDNNYAYFDVSQFPQDLKSDFENLAKDIVTSRTKGIILDLRNNPGGYVSAAEDLLGLFLKKNEGMYYLDYREGSRIARATSDGKYADYPLVVLIDASSASASEIVAAALKDNGRATIVGQKSFGKGVAQQLFFYDDGSSLKLTIAEWLSPKGERLNKEGVKPDVDAVDREDTEIDEALQKALRTLKNGR